MYQIAQKSRYVLRLCVIAAAFLLLAGFTVASLLPLLMEGRAIRESFERSLSAWSGGPVIVEGPLRIASFATFSIEAEGVRLPGGTRFYPLNRVDAKSITAIASLSSLIRGKLEFKRIVISSARFVFKRGSASGDNASSFGMETANRALSLAARSPYPDFELRQPLFFAASGAHKPYQRVALDQIRVGKRSLTESPIAGSEKAALDFYAKAAGFELFFNGELDQPDETASGVLRVKVAAENETAKAIAAATAPWELGNSVVVTGDLSWSRDRLALDSAVMSFGDHSAKGSLALAVAKGRALLEGTLAYDSLDVTPVAEGGGAGLSGSRPLTALSFAQLGKDRGLDLDLRLSAELFRAGGLQAAPLAVALTSQHERFSADIAELGLFGGNVTGRLAYDPAQPGVLSVSASGSRLDSRALSASLGLPLSVSGMVAVNAGVTFPLSENAEASKTTSGSFTLNFPAGGSLDGEVSQKLSAALMHQTGLWGLRASYFPFTSAALDGTFKPGALELKIGGESGNSRIDGVFHVAYPGALITGALEINPVQDMTETQISQTGASDATAPAKLLVSGTAAAVTFTPPGKPNLSN